MRHQWKEYKGFIGRWSVSCVVRQRLGRKLYKIEKDWKIKKPKITGMFDLRCNKRSTSTWYDSKSGHELLIGGKFKKVIDSRVLSKDCTIWAIIK